MSGARSPHAGHVVMVIHLATSKVPCREAADKRFSIRTGPPRLPASMMQAHRMISGKPDSQSQQRAGEACKPSRITDSHLQALSYPMITVVAAFALCPLARSRISNGEGALEPAVAVS